MKLFKHKTTSIGLALGSGVARGLTHIGVLKAFKEAAIPIDMIAGTSMRAMVSTCFAKEDDLILAELYLCN